MGSGSQWSGSQRGESRGRFRCFSQASLAVCKVLADLFVYAPVIDHKCVPREHQHSAVFGSEEALERGGGGRGSGTVPQMYGSNLDLGWCSLSFNLQVVKTISGALCLQYVSPECVPCKSLMYLIYLTLVVVEPFHLGSGSPPLRAKP